VHLVADSLNLSCSIFLFPDGYSRLPGLPKLNLINSTKSFQYYYFLCKKLSTGKYFFHQDRIYFVHVNESAVFGVETGVLISVNEIKNAALNGTYR